MKLSLPASFASSIFPLLNSKALLLGTTKANLLFLNLETLSLNDFNVSFTNSKIHKIQQILTKENNFVFLNDYNQILFCKFIREKSFNDDQNKIKKNIQGKNIFD